MSKPTLSLIESLFAQLKDYVDNRIELFKLKIVDKASGIASAIVTGVIMFIVLLLFFLFLNIGIALLIGDLLGKSYLGFLILAGFYAIAGLVMFLMREKILKAPVSGMIISKFYKDGSKKKDH